MPNRLAQETSPYLRQHAENPVDWMPWGEEAFARARAEDKPIFLSIGYSTCHWCHVMAHESFENPAIAGLLNDHFVPVKVDREERPDVDRVYMAYVQALTGHGGWPLSAWLTPDLKPFYAGTYFPPEDRGGRPGFATVLRALERGWREERPDLLSHGEKALALLRGSGAQPPAADPLAEAAGGAFQRCFDHLVRGFDEARGGFDGPPKFPRASNLAFLFRCAVLQGQKSEVGREAVRMASRTLEQMARGGIHDHVGGGFHRYAVDEDWFVPHFEKMLYDQAQIASAALEAWQATGDERHAWLAGDVLDYVLGDLAHPAGGFYSAEDADSAVPGAGTEKAEGAFYVWTRAEIEAVLGPSEAALVTEHFGVRPDGNVPAERDPFGEFTGRNILAQVRPLAETAKALGLGSEEASNRIAAALGKLREVRSGRPRPHLDSKIVTAWNGLAISALARAAAAPASALSDRRKVYLDAAGRAASFLRSELFDPARGILFRSWCGRRGAAEGFAEDYALLIQGLLDLYESGFDMRWLQWAVELQGKMDELFWDGQLGGYFNSAAGAADIVVRLKEDYDGAEPAPSSVAAMNLLRIGSEACRERANALLGSFQVRWSGAPQALPQMLCALELALEPQRHVVLAGNPGSADFRALTDVLAERLGPRRSVLAADGGPGQLWLAARLPWIADMRPVEGRATAYVCEDFSCQAPLLSAVDLRRLLQNE